MTPGDSQFRDMLDRITKTHAEVARNDLRIDTVTVSVSEVEAQTNSILSELRQMQLDQLEVKRLAQQSERDMMKMLPRLNQAQDDIRKIKDLVKQIKHIVMGGVATWVISLFGIDEAIKMFLKL